MNNLSRFFEPDGWQEGSFKAGQGKKIRYGHSATTGKAEGTVVITTGFADFIEPYFETIHAYLSRGYDVWMMEWPGHGKSSKSDVGGPATLDHFIAALEKFRHTVVEPVEKKPVILSTHSLGGQVALRFLSMHPEAFDVAILATPMIDHRAEGQRRAILQTVFTFAVEMGLGDTLLHEGRRNATKALIEERKELRDENPVRTQLHRAFLLLKDDIRADDPSIGMMASIFRSAAQVNEPSFLQKIETPVLLALGRADKVVNAKAVRSAAKALPRAKLVEIEGAVHGLWLERDAQREGWWREIDAFLAAMQKSFNPGQNQKPPQPKGP